MFSERGKKTCSIGAGDHAMIATQSEPREPAGARRRDGENGGRADGYNSVELFNLAVLAEVRNIEGRSTVIGRRQAAFFHFTLECAPVLSEFVQRTQGVAQHGGDQAVGRIDGDRNIDTLSPR